MTTKALLLENIHPDASARLAKEGYQVDTLTRALGDDELIAAIGHRFHRDYDVVLRAVLFAVDRYRARQVTGVAAPAQVR